MTKPDPQKIRSYCSDTADGFRRKADKNKTESLICFVAVISCTLATPLFVSLANDLVLGKIIPSVLSVVAAGATAWLQLRKPQQLWTLYRTAQRRLEDHSAKHEFLLGEYRGAADADSLLAENVAAIAIDAHWQWLPMVPGPDRLGQLKGAPLGLEGKGAQHV